MGKSDIKSFFVTIRATADLANKIAAVALREKRTMSAMASILIEEALEARKSNATHKRGS